MTSHHQSVLPAARTDRLASTPESGEDRPVYVKWPRTRKRAALSLT